MSGATGNLARRAPEPPSGARQGGTSLKLAERALACGDPYIALAAHPAAAGRRLELEGLIFAAARDRRRFAAAPYTPESVLHALAQDADARIRTRVARHPATGPHTLEWLLREWDYWQLQLAAAGHPRATPALLSRLPWRASPELRPALCANPNAPPEMLAELLESATAQERKAVAGNPAADASALSHLWRDSRDDAYICAEAAVHAALPDALLQEAAYDTRSLVRRKAAQNPGACRATLLRLLQDADAGVRAAAAR
ncbi:MAG: hypothetical protein OXU61_08265, partial [Gammaproteobacteria bacterium]|nr:hypothetical protein [Gammaproteobacteria bacterium]